MGNAVRSTLGNLCGGQQSAKDSPDDEERPVAKPKDSKKKEKKNAKKNKKEKNGDINVPLDGQTNTQENETKKEESVTETKNEQPLSEQQDDVTANRTSSYDDATEEEKNENETKNENNDKVHDELPNELNNTEQTANSGDHDNETGVNEQNSGIVNNNEETISPVEMRVEESAPVDFPITNEKEASQAAGGTPSLSESLDVSKDDLSSTDEVDKNGTMHYIFEIEHINPESIGITYADEIFNKSKSEYEALVDCAKQFRSSLVNFNSSVLPAEVSDFDKCWSAYLALLNEEARVESAGKQRTESRSQVDICDISVNLQQLRAAGLVFLDEVERTKAPIQHLLAEAGKVDVIEYVKGKMVEGEQLGITSKFSAPGKYRRNMKQLKKAVREIDGSETEVRYIVNQLEEQEAEISKNIVSKTQEEAVVISEANEEEIVAEAVKVEESEPIFPLDMDAESEIVPTEKKLDKTNEDVFETISKLPTEAKKRHSSSGSKANENEEKKLTLLEKSAEANIESENKSEPITYVIENIPEGGNNTPPADSSTPIGRKETFEIRDIKTPREDVKIANEDHNTLDYGKYVFIDPTTGDIQTMRNRSRSLDSLVSMTSNRSSISRFGSFELVTDFEINIAEQNQQKLLT